MRPGITAKVVPALIALFAAVCVPAARADSVATKNREGNRLFEAGKYEEAEKAYLEAQARLQDRPELSYNLGNALIKQKKYDQALKFLRQAESSGTSGLQANSWYNAGNALFEMQDYANSIQAYTQALRINPSDRDAKHNLELALKKLQQQQQAGNDKNQGNQDQQQQGQDKQQDQKDQKGNEQKQDQGQQQPQDQQDQKQPANPESSQAPRDEGSFSKERALQILDALQNQELAEQRRLLERRARRKATGRDW